MPAEITIPLALWLGFNAVFVLWRHLATRNRQP